MYQAVNILHPICMVRGLSFLREESRPQAIEKSFAGSSGKVRGWQSPRKDNRSYPRGGKYLHDGKQEEMSRGHPLECRDAPSTWHTPLPCSLSAHCLHSPPPGGGHSTQVINSFLLPGVLATPPARKTQTPGRKGPCLPVTWDD